MVFVEKSVEEHHYYKLTDEFNNIVFARKDENGDEHSGTTNEEVISILVHRLNQLQKKFPCCENALAITKLEEALIWLKKRTGDRINRGVEGQHKI